MIQFNKKQRRLALALATTLSLLLGGTLSAEEGDESLMKVFSITDDQFVKIPKSESPHGPVNAMFAGATPGWSSIGVHRFEEGKTWIRDWVYWYHEFVYVTRGRGKVTLSAPPYTTPEVHNVKAGDFFTIPPGLKVTLEGVGKDVFEIVWSVPE